MAPGRRRNALLPFMPMPTPASTRRAIPTALAVSLLSACATGSHEARDESADRIEAAIGTPAHEAPFPEGLAFGGEGLPPMSDEPTPSESPKEGFSGLVPSSRLVPKLRSAQPMCTPPGEPTAPGDPWYPECVQVPELRYHFGPGSYRGPLP